MIDLEFAVKTVYDMLRQHRIILIKKANYTHVSDATPKRLVSRPRRDHDDEQV